MVSGKRKTYIPNSELRKGYRQGPGTGPIWKYRNRFSLSESSLK